MKERKWRLPATILLLLTAFIAQAQNCSCSEKLQFVKKQVEDNYAGFSDKVNAANRKTYEAFAQQSFLRAKRIEKPAVCFALIHDWLKFFKDGHVQVTGNPANDDDSLVLLERLKNTETISLSPARISQLKKSTNLEEGVYVSDDSSYTIAIIKSKNEYRDFAGVILSSKTDMWKPGQVKLELIKIERNKYDAIVYFRDHSYKVRDYIFKGDRFNEDWIKMRPGKAGKNENSTIGNVSAKKINGNTLYIQIGTFDGSNAKAIDSVFKANEELLKTTPHLVIDIRGNGGGSDFAFRSVTPWLYTNPLTHAGADVRATQDNITGWRATVLDNPEVPDDTKAEVRELLIKMEKNLGKFVSTGDDDTLTMQKVEPYPGKVVILMDEGCASTAEEFLLMARQSKRVTLMGTHSSGILDYANVRGSGVSPCKDLAIYLATTRSRRIDAGKAIDNIGIKPDVILTKDINWVTEAVKYMDAKKP